MQTDKDLARWHTIITCMKWESIFMCWLLSNIQFVYILGWKEDNYTWYPRTLCRLVSVCYSLTFYLDRRIQGTLSLRGRQAGGLCSREEALIGRSRQLQASVYGRLSIGMSFIVASTLTSFSSASVSIFPIYSFYLLFLSPCFLPSSLPQPFPPFCFLPWLDVSLASQNTII